MSEVKNWAVIDSSNIVINLINWDGETQWLSPENTYVVDLTGIENTPSFGWTYENGIFVPPTPEPPKKNVPKSITRRQCSLQLLNEGIITSTEALEMTRNGIPPSIVMKYIETLEPEAQIRAEIDFAAENYYRNNELLILLMTTNGWSEDEIDDFFIAASKL